MRRFFVFAVGVMAFLAVSKAEETSPTGAENIDLREKAAVAPPGVKGERSIIGEIEGKSAPNAEGTTIIRFYRKDLKDTVLALRTKEGKIIFLYQYSNEKAIPLVDTGNSVFGNILWLNKDEFASVGSGRMDSLYQIYRLERNHKGNEENTIYACTVVKGTLHFRAEWKVNGGKLEAWQYGRLYASMG